MLCIISHLLPLGEKVQQFLGLFWEILVGYVWNQIRLSFVSLHTVLKIRFAYF